MILAEAQGVLLDDERRYRQRYHYPDEAAINFIDGLRVLASLVTELSEVSVVSRDPNDDMVVATAQRAQAAYIVTRDKDLLSLHHYEGITMITPEAFIAILREQEARRNEGNVVGISEAQRLRGRINPPG